MEPTTYFYSKSAGWTGTLVFLFFTLMPLYICITINKQEAWLYIGIPIILPAAFLQYFIRACFIPVIKGYVALELDEEKLRCHITDTTIYWKDVVEISQSYQIYYSGISFEMVDESEDLSVPTKWISGSNKSIYNKMQEYFARTL